jgi:hypothetical protein
MVSVDVVELRRVWAYGSFDKYEEGNWERHGSD